MNEPTPNTNNFPNIPPWVWLIVATGGGGGVLMGAKELTPQVMANEYVTHNELNSSLHKLDQELANRHAWMMEQQKQMGQLSQKTEIIHDQVQAIDDRQRAMHTGLAEVAARQGRMEVQVKDTKDVLMQIFDKVTE